MLIGLIRAVETRTKDVSGEGLQEIEAEDVTTLPSKVPEGYPLLSVRRV